MNPGTIGGRIRYLRERSKKSQTELAKILYVAQGTVSSWERDKSVPEVTTLIHLSEYFHVTLDYLITGKSRF